MKGFMHPEIFIPSTFPVSLLEFVAFYIVFETTSEVV